MVCGFTGHRPEKLPWGRNESDERCAALKQLLEQRIREALTLGADTFLCGMARGCDLYFAEAVLKLRQIHPIRLEAILPCPEQADRWPWEEQQRYRRILTECDAVYLLQESYTKGCMLRRNRAMVDKCQLLISVWDGSQGGTAATVRYAEGKGVQIDRLWL